MDLSSAEEWLRKNSFLLVLEDEDDESMTVDPVTRPTQTQYEECARIATEFREDVAGGTLMDLLRRETRHAFLCKVGVRYWSSGFRLLALLAFERSLALCPKAPTYFNLAVCRDDMGQADLAAQAIARFYELVKTPEERSQAEAALAAHGKHHLIRDETRTASQST
jgi:lipoprotein NlpI